MELNNKTILLIVLVLIVLLAIGTGIAIINSMDTKGNTNNSTNTVTITPSSHPTTSTNVTTAPNNQNNTQTNNNSTPIVTATASPTVIASPTITVTPTSTAQATTSWTDQFTSSTNQFLFEDDRITVQLYVLHNQSEIDQYNAETLSMVLPSSFTPITDATVQILSRSATALNNGNSYQYNYQPVDIPGNPLTSSNCNAYGRPSYTFTKVPSDTHVIWIEYNGRVFRNWKTLSSTSHTVIPGAIVFDQGDVIPGDVTGGTIYGCVNADRTIVSANVSLYTCVQGDSPGYYINTGLVNISGNPQSSGSSGDQRLFRFDGMQPGLYNVTAERDGLSGHYIIDLKQNWNGLTADPTNGKYITISIA